MKGMWLVARREIIVRGTSKSYLIGLIASVVLVGLVTMLPNLLQGDSEYQAAVVGTDSEALAEAIPAAGKAVDTKIEVTELDSAAAAEKAVKDDEYDFAIVDNETVMSTGSINQDIDALINSVHQSIASQRQLTEAGFDADEVNQALQVDPLSKETFESDDAAARQGIAYFVVIILFFMVMMPTMYVASGVVEEKSSRIVEILLSSLNTWQLLCGKVLGLGVLGFINLVVPISVGLAAGSATGALDMLPSGLTGTVLSALIWWVLGFSFFAAMAGSLASLVSRQEDMNSAIGPITMLMIAVYAVASVYVWMPTETVARVLSFVPPFSMLLMPVRDAAGDAPWWQQTISGVLMAAGCVAMFMIGSFIYRRSIMLTGSKVKLSQVFKKAA